MNSYVYETIKCSCGYDTGLNKNGFFIVIPPQGLICPRCGNVILKCKDTFPYPKPWPKPQRPERFPKPRREDDIWPVPYKRPDVKPWKIPEDLDPPIKPFKYKDYTDSNNSKYLVRSAR